MNKAVFLDRDGTIVDDVGYLNDPAKLSFIPGSIEAIKKLNDAGYKVVVITNQAGVARGLITENMLQTIDKTLHRQLLSNGAHLDGLYYCPHHPEYGYYPYKQGCQCRKPQPGLIKQAANDLKIELSQSYMIGDKSSDLEAGKNAGTKTVHVQIGQQTKHQLKVKPDFSAQDLSQAVNWIIDADKA